VARLVSGACTIWLSLHPSPAPHDQSLGGDAGGVRFAAEATAIIAAAKKENEKSGAAFAEVVQQQLAALIERVAKYVHQPDDLRFARSDCRAPNPLAGSSLLRASSSR
jgi:hypothetical protein